MNWLVSRITNSPIVLLWVALAAFVAGGAAVGVPVWKYQGAKTTAVQAQFDGFVATTKALGEAAQKMADATRIADQRKKDEADHENSDALATLAGTIKRLRDATDSRRGVLPPAPAGSVRPEVACLDRTLTERALGEFLAEARGLADEGTKSTADLNTAKRWAQ